MVVMTVCCLLSAGFGWAGIYVPLVGWALVLVAVGCLITLVRRTTRIVRELESR
ncbi:MAG: hypothetical protein ACOVMP_06155 [Chthoniobacterales bacterium]